MLHNGERDPTFWNVYLLQNCSELFMLEAAKKSELQVRIILCQKLFVVCFASTNTHASPS